MAGLERLVRQLGEDVAAEKSGVAEKSGLGLVEPMPFYDAQPHQFKGADEIGHLKQAILCRGHFGNEHRLGRKCLKRLFKQFLDLALTIVVIDFYLVIAGKLRGVVGEENGRDCSLPSGEGIPPRAGDSSLTAFVDAYCSIIGGECARGGVSRPRRSGRLRP